jgi:surface antigen
VRLWVGVNPFPGRWWVPPPVVYGAPPVVYGAPPVVVVPGTPVQPQQSSPPEQTTQDQYCREFQRDIIIDGKPERAYGTACLQPDGTWKIMP